MVLYCIVLYCIVLYCIVLYSYFVKSTQYHIKLKVLVSPITTEGHRPEGTHIRQITPIYVCCNDYVKVSSGELKAEI